MAEVRFTELPVAITPLAGNEIMAVVQDGVSVQTPVSEVSSTLEEAYTIGNGIIDLIPGKPFKITGIVAGQVSPVMTGAQFDAIPIPDNGLFAWNSDTNRFRVNDGTPGAPTYEELAYVSDVNLVDSQVAYDNSVDGNIDLIVDKPFSLSSTVAGLLMTRMTEPQFEGISNPDNGLLSYITDTSRFKVNRGSPGTPIFEDVAYLTDIPVFQDVNFGEMFFNSNVTETVITTPGTFVKINAVYNSGNLSGFSQATGTLTYTNDDTAEVKISASLSATMTLDTDTMSVAIFKNGAEITKSKQSTFLGPVSPGLQALSCQALTTLSNTDFIEIFVTNEDDADNIIVQEFNCIVQEIIVGLGDPSSLDLQSAYDNGTGEIVQQIGKAVSVESPSNAFPPVLNFQMNGTPSFAEPIFQSNYFADDSTSISRNFGGMDHIAISTLASTYSGRTRFFGVNNGGSPESYFEVQGDIEQNVFLKTVRMDNSFSQSNGNVSFSAGTNPSGNVKVNTTGAFLSGAGTASFRMEYDNPISGAQFGVFPRVSGWGLNFTRATVIIPTEFYALGAWEEVWFTGDAGLKGSNLIQSFATNQAETFPVGHTLEWNIVGQLVSQGISIIPGEFSQFRFSFGSNFTFVSEPITTSTIANFSKSFTMNLKVTRIQTGFLKVAAAGYYIPSNNVMTPIVWTIPTTAVAYDDDVDAELTLEYNKGITSTQFDFVCSSMNLIQYSAFDFIPL